MCVFGLITLRMELPSWFCRTHMRPVLGSTFRPSTEPVMEYVWRTSPCKLYYTIVLLPLRPVLSAPLV